MATEAEFDRGRSVKDAGGTPSAFGSSPCKGGAGLCVVLLWRSGTLKVKGEEAFEDLLVFDVGGPTIGGENGEVAASPTAWSDDLPIP